MRPTRSSDPDEPLGPAEDYREEWEDEDNPDPYAVDSEDSGEESELETLDEDVSEESEESEELEEGEGNEDDDSPIRPWVRESVVGELAESELEISLAEALKRVDAAHIDFQYDVDASAEAAYLLARTAYKGMGPRLVKSIEVLLRRAGVEVIRRGVRPGIAADGREYHHFFRVESADGSVPSKIALRAALRHRPVIVTETPDRSVADGPSGIHQEDLRATLERAIAESAAAKRQALGALHIHDRRIVGYRRRIEDTQSLVREVFTAIRNEIANPHAKSTLIAEVEEQRRQISRLTNDIEEALTTAAAQETEATNLQEMLRWYQLRDERSKIRAGDAVLVQDTATVMISKGGRDEFVRTLLPELHFLGDSIPILWNETDRAAWLRTLALLALDHTAFIEQMHRRGYVKRVRGKADWNEVRGSKGSKDMVRLYFTDKRPSLCTGSERWLVRIHIKHDEKQQSRIIASLP